MGASQAVPTPQWKEITDRKRAERAERIPEAWRLSSEVQAFFAKRPISVFDNPYNENICPNILSAKELELTNPARDATGLLELLKKGSVSCEELTVAFCKRAAIAQQLTNCLSEILFEEAIERAQKLDEAVKKDGSKVMGPLYGLPITVKDSFYMKGIDASIGISSLCYDPSTTNSQLVDILQDYGAIIIAKTSVPQTMLTADTDSVVFGRTCNAYRSDFGAAGSSGGEGVMLAMGASALGLGSDGAGSVRMPSFVNGVFGFKPSGYRLPLDGRGVFDKGFVGSTSIGPVSVAGFIARSVLDARLVTRLVSEARPWDVNPFLLPSPWLNYQVDANRPLRIGVWIDHDHVHPLPPVARVFKLAQDRLKAAGHDLIPFQGPSIANVWKLQKDFGQWQGLQTLRNQISTEPMTNIVKLTGILEPPEPILPFTHSVLQGLNSGIASLVQDMAKGWNATGQPLDALLWIPAPHPAVPFDAYTDLSFTGLFNVIDWPAVVLPMNEHVDLAVDGTSVCPPVPESKLFGAEDRRVQKLYRDNEAQFAGLPLSVQLIGRRGEDERLLAVADAIHGLIKSKA